MTKVIALANQKGGVGKTTTAVNFGIGLVRQCKKVLLIDADSQGNLTAALGWKRPDELKDSISTVMRKILEDGHIEESEALLQHNEGAALLPSNIELSVLEMQLFNSIRREYVLADYLKTVIQDYDYVLVDCSPSLGMVTINALTAADSVIIPVQSHYLPTIGMNQLLHTISRVKKGLNQDLRIEGALLTMVDNRTNFAKDVAAALRSGYSEKLKVFETEIPLSVRAAEAAAAGTSIYEYDTNGKAAKAYKQFTKEVIANV